MPRCSEPNQPNQQAIASNHGAGDQDDIFGCLGEIGVINEPTIDDPLASNIVSAQEQEQQNAAASFYFTDTQQAVYHYQQVEFDPPPGSAQHMAPLCAAFAVAAQHQAPPSEASAISPAEHKIELRAVTGFTGYRVTDGGDHITAFVVAEDLDTGPPAGTKPMSEHKASPFKNPKKYQPGYKTDLNEVATSMPRNHSLAFIGKWAESVFLERSFRLRPNPPPSCLSPAHPLSSLLYSNPIEVPIHEFSDSNKKGPYHEGFEHGWRYSFSEDKPSTWPQGLNERGNPWMCEEYSFRMMSTSAYMLFPLDSNGKQLFDPWLGWKSHEVSRTPWLNGVEKGIIEYHATMSQVPQHTDRNRCLRL